MGICIFCSNPMNITRLFRNYKALRLYNIISFVKYLTF